MSAIHPMKQAALRAAEAIVVNAANREPEATINKAVENYAELLARNGELSEKQAESIKDLVSQLNPIEAITTGRLEGYIDQLANGLLAMRQDFSLAELIRLSDAI